MLPRESIATASAVPPICTAPTLSSPPRLVWNGWAVLENVVLVTFPLARMCSIDVAWTDVRPVVPTIGNWYCSAAESLGISVVGGSSKLAVDRRAERRRRRSPG